MLARGVACRFSLRRAMLGLHICLALLALAWKPATPAIVINEILYDPAGSDSGREFVELANTGPFAASLEDLALEAGNGGRANDWKVIWRGGADRWIRPGGLYRIGLDGPGDGEPAEFNIQNGPDALRLVKQGFVLDLVGWGDHLHAEYYEAHPTPLARSGRSLARAVDGVDTDDNLVDFAVAQPTPGRPNRPLDDWAVRFSTPSPELPRPGDRITVALLLDNRGVETRTPPLTEVIEGRRSILVGWTSVVEPGSSAEETLLLDAPADTGRATWLARILQRDQVPENDSDSLRLRVGHGPVRIVEILASPLVGQPEWIELRADGPAGRLIAGLVLDAHGRRIELAPRRIDAETRIGLVVEDSAAMRTQFPNLSPSTIWSHKGAWPRLRNGGRGGGISDSLRLIGSDGLVCEIALPGPAPGRGVSLERLAADLPEGPGCWVPCGEPGGSTPGRDSEASASRLAGEAFAVRPRAVRPGESVCTFEGSVGSRPGEVRLDLFDLSGRPIRCLLRDLWAAGQVVATWNGKDEMDRAVAPGLYVAVLEIARGSGDVERHRVAVAVAP